MSNFYKPSYSRGQKRSAIYSREDGKRNSKKDHKVFGEEKIKDGLADLETDQNAMFHRKNVFTAQNIHEDASDELIKTTNPSKQTNARFNQTTKQGFRKNIERPLSKQEPRVKGWNTSGLLKSTLPETNRPQTSKGQRAKPLYKQKLDEFTKRRVSLEKDDFKQFAVTNEFQRKNHGVHPASSASSRKGTQTNRIEFKTSIDPEFLSLFAN